MTLPPGTRVRLVAPSPLLELTSDTGTVIGLDEFGGYIVIELDKPARLRSEELRSVVLEHVCESEDNLEVVEA